jgi:RNA polymerase sigma-70 factor (ECF subfamily)
MAGGRSVPPPADADLVAALVAGSQDALAALYDRHATAIHAAALRITGDRQTAEDVVQDVFLALWNRAEQFDPNRGSLAAWLGAIARNRAVDRLRADGRRPRFVGLPGSDGQGTGEDLERAMLGRRTTAAQDAIEDPAEALETHELRESIGAALAGMPAEERRVIVLAYRDELTQREIAAALGWPLGTVKTRTRRALARLRQVLADVHDPGLAPPAADEPDPPRQPALEDAP